MVLRILASVRSQLSQILSVESWTRYLTTLSLGFLICKMKTVNYYT